MGEQDLNKIAEYQLRPNIIDRVSKDLIYFGFPLPTCTGEDDPKWLIQVYHRDSNGIERTGFVNGRRNFNSAWSDRYSLTYKMGAGFSDIIPIGSISQNSSQAK